MDENLIIKSYYEICGFNEEDINKVLDENRESLKNEKYLIKGCDTVAEINNIEDETFDGNNEMPEQLNSNEDYQFESYDDFLLPSKMLKSSKIPISVIYKLDDLFNRYFNMGVNICHPVLRRDKMNDLEIDCRGNKDLFEAWCMAGYHTGVVFGLSNQTGRVKRDIDLENDEF